VSDEINMNENVKDLIDLINWNNVTLQISLKFALKFVGVIDKLGLDPLIKSILLTTLLRSKINPAKLGSNNKIIIVR
jgi:hypothetical protein